MPLPDFLSIPLFRLIYPQIRKSEKSPIPPIRRKVHRVDPQKASQFDEVFDANLLENTHKPIRYDLPYPKIDFFNYLCDWRGFVAHGSNLPDMKTLQPIRLSTDSSEFGNREQIFSSPDAVWAMWFAILDKNVYRVTQNGCVRVGHSTRREKYYHFELSRDLKGKIPFTDGTIYLARTEDFPSRHNFAALNFFGGDLEEWGSSAAVKPVAKIRVTPQDFPYLDQVQYCIKPICK